MASLENNYGIRSATAETIPPLQDFPDTRLELYSYESLCSATSIRLLELHPSEAGEIRCSQTNVDLDDNPTFVALSYTWRNPITVYERQDEEPLLMGIEAILQ